MKILFIGDVVGRAGRLALADRLGRLIDIHQVDLVVANGENAAAGFGLTLDVARDLFDAGVDVLTSGNHIWDKKEILRYLDQPRHCFGRQITRRGRRAGEVAFMPPLPGSRWGS